MLSCISKDEINVLSFDHVYCPLTHQNGCTIVIDKNFGPEPPVCMQVLVRIQATRDFSLWSKVNIVTVSLMSTEDKPL